MNVSYVTLLTNDSFLPGALVLNRSLRQVGSGAGFLALVSSGLADGTLRELKRNRIDYRTVEPIKTPHDEGFMMKTCRRLLKKRLLSQRFFHVYTKLRIWELTEYDKVVFLDSDMMVCGNVDDLFDRPDWSAVNAGGELPALNHWRELNSGLLVIRPSKDVYRDMIDKMAALPSRDGGDQGFLQSYFPRWPELPDLHLPHIYNVFVAHLDDYAKDLGYGIYGFRNSAASKAIRVLHFAGRPKPWEACPSWVNAQLIEGKSFLCEAFNLWLSCYAETVKGGERGST